MKNKLDSSKETGGTYFGYALMAFLGLGLEILILVLESMAYGMEIGEFSVFQNCIHWSITCLVWGSMMILLITHAKKGHSFDIFLKTERICGKQWILVLLLSAAGIIFMNFGWDGFKVAEEFKSHGMPEFFFQYLYYMFESGLVVLIVVFGQKAGQVWFSMGLMGKETSKIPWGGIVLALTWGLVHILTQDLATGLEGLVISLLFGMIYLVMKKNTAWMYLITAFIFLM